MIGRGRQGGSDRTYRYSIEHAAEWVALPPQDSKRIVVPVRIYRYVDIRLRHHCIVEGCGAHSFVSHSEGAGTPVRHTLVVGLELVRHRREGQTQETHTNIKKKQIMLTDAKFHHLSH